MTVRATLALAVALVAGWTVGVRASPCEGEGTGKAVVREVGADLSLLLDDGRRLRLAGLEPVRDTDSRPVAGATARAALAGWLSGRTVGVRTAGPPDRWERLAAFVSAPTAGDGAPLAVGLALVDAGLARVRPEAALGACGPELLKAEDGARAAALGLWGDPYYAVRTAAEGAALLALAGEWVVVEGRVTHVGRTRTATFLDLDANRAGLALRLSRAVPFMPGQGGTGQDGWTGRRVRARGVLEDRGGPQLDIRDAAQVELLPEAGAPAPGGGAGDAGN